MVYFILDGDWDDVESYLKIGFSITNGNSRLSSLQLGNPKKLRVGWEMPGDSMLEAKVHELFHRFRVRGEWFRYDEDCADLIDIFSHRVVDAQSQASTYEEYEAQVSGWIANHLAIRGINYKDVADYLNECCVGII